MMNVRFGRLDYALDTVDFRHPVTHQLDEQTLPLMRNVNAALGQEDILSIGGEDGLSESGRISRFVSGDHLRVMVKRVKSLVANDPPVLEVVVKKQGKPGQRKERLSEAAVLADADVVTRVVKEAARRLIPGL